MFITQISVYLENRDGTLRSLTQKLGNCNIDVLALSIADTAEFGIVRIVVREEDIQSAVDVLKNSGFMVKTNNVFCIAVPNKPAGLDTVLSIIEDNNISIKYLYSLNYIIGNKALIVMRLTHPSLDNDQIANLLASQGITAVSQSEINIL